jgi:hypothetical protein
MLHLQISTCVPVMHRAASLRTRLHELSAFDISNASPLALCSRLVPSPASLMLSLLLLLLLLGPDRIRSRTVIHLAISMPWPGHSLADISPPPSPQASQCLSISAPRPTASAKPPRPNFHTCAACPISYWPHCAHYGSSAGRTPTPYPRMSAIMRARVDCALAAAP